jgi:uncharacterized protein (DUF849 family)
MTDPVIITAAITGSAMTRGKNPAVPVTPAEIAASALDAAAAGAAMVHLHVRDPVTGRPSGDHALYREVVDRIAASSSDVIVNLTTGFGGFFVPGDANPMLAAPEFSNLMDPVARVAHIVALTPEVCSLDVGTANFGDRVFMNTAPHLRIMAAAMRDAGVKPEIEVFEAGHIVFARHMIAHGLLAEPPHFQFCLGVPWCMPATEAAIAFMKSLLPANATWSAFGVGRAQFPIVRDAVRAGGHVRVGLEDNLYLDAGTLAPSNAALVARAAEIIRAEDRTVATPAEARRILSLPDRHFENARTVQAA